MKNKFLLTFIILLSGLSAFSQSIRLTSLSPDVFCGTGKDTMKFSVNYTNIPQNSNIVFYQSANPAFNPYLGQGDSIGFINVGSNTSGGGGQVTTACPEILGIFIDACDQGGVLKEVDNEYMVITSGNAGFNVSSLKIQLPNSSINVSGCPFLTPSAATMTQLRNGTCDNTTLIAAGQADFIPANAIVIIFTGRGALYNYNFSSYCSSGQPIYILQNSCSPGTANFVNNAPGSCPSNGYRATSITVGSCTDKLTYYACSLPPFDNINPNANDGNYVIHLPNTDTSSVTNGGIRNNAADKCNGLRYDSISGATIIKYPIPNDGSANPVTNFCNTGYHYIKAITHPNGSQPVSNTLQFKLICLDLTATPLSTNICSGQNVIINNSSSDPNATFAWSVTSGALLSGSGAGAGSQINQVIINNNTPPAIDSLIYHISSIDAGCEVMKEVKIYVNPLPSKPNLGNDTTICGAISKTLTTGNSHTNTWTRNGVQIATNTPSINITQAGTFIVSITNSCGNVADTIIITQINSQPKPNLGKDTSFCGTFSKTLTTGSATTTWFLDNIQIATNTASITATQAGTYVANVTGSCGTASDTIALSQSSGINFDFGANSTSVCIGSSITLDASNAYDSYQWSTGAVSQSISVSTPGKYWVDVFKGGCKGTDTIQVLQIDKEPKPNLGADASFCSPFSQVLTTGKSNTTWYLNFVQIATGASVTATQFGTYVAKLTNACGDVADTIVLTQTNSQPPINLGNDTAYCGPFSRVLSTGNPATVWSTGVTAASITVTAPGTYTASITGGCGNASDAITITQNPGLNFSFGGNTSLCRGSSVGLDAGTGFDTYLWNTGASTQAITVTLPGKYWARVTKGGCTASDTINVTEIDKPAPFSIGNDTSICGVFSKVLSTGNPQTVWSTGVTAAQITVTTSGKYYATISNSCGSASDTILISSSGGLNLNLGRDTVICQGNNLTLNATVSGSGIQYKWITGEITPTISVSQFGKYWVEVTNGVCTVSDTILVDVTDKPAAIDFGADTAFCGNFSLQLFTGDANTVWTRNGTQIATGVSVTATQPGSYAAKISNPCGSVSDTIVIQQFALPAVNIGKDTTICDSITLSVGNGSFSSIVWSTTDTVPSIVVFASGLYSVKVSNINCVNSDTVRITKECFYDVYLPTGFTPNGDGKNDILVPLSDIKGMVVIDFSVFNRWGEKVFESSGFVPGDSSQGWNGTYKNADCQVDTYVFYFSAKMPDDKVKTYKGTVLLLR